MVFRLKHLQKLLITPRDIKFIFIQINSGAYLIFKSLWNENCESLIYLLNSLGDLLL